MATKPLQGYRLDQEVHDWIREQAEKCERGPGWYLNNLLLTNHVKKETEFNKKTKIK